MSWLCRISQNFMDTGYWNRHFLRPEDITGNLEVYQSPDFPNVFLGGENELEEAEILAGRSMCKVIDCRDLPEISHDHPSWDFGFYTTTKYSFDRKVQEVVKAIRTLKCPIYIHCALGANRSVSVLAAAVSRLTHKSLNSVLSDIRSKRSVTNPQDPYYLMALEDSYLEDPSDSDRVLRDIDQSKVAVAFKSFKVSNQDLINEFHNRWMFISKQRRELESKIQSQTYREYLQQEAGVLEQINQLYISLVEWMESSVSFIQDQETLKRWQQQIAVIRENISSNTENISEFRGSWNPQDHDIGEVLEWIESSDIKNILPILDELGIEYEEINFPKKSIIRFETPQGVYVYEDGSISEANEWVTDSEPFDYYNPDPEDSFWSSNLRGMKLYHATDSENVESILQTGLAERSDTRGIQNRNTPSAVFVSDNPDDIAAYGDSVIEIDVEAMQADRYMPSVSFEEPIEEQRWKEALAHKLGLEDFVWEVESGLSPTTFVFYGPIPAKYLRLLGTKV